MRREVRRWYSAYAGYFFFVTPSVIAVEPWKRRVRSTGPTIVTFRRPAPAAIENA